MDTGNMALSSRQDWQMYLPRLLMTADSMTDKFKEIGDVENGARREAENESAPNNQMAFLRALTLYFARNLFLALCFLKRSQSPWTRTRVGVFG